MNCEQVEERLSAYLDNMLAPQERRDVTIHLQTCPRCMMSLAELRQNDILLSQLPRESPSAALRTRLFAIPEVRQLLEAAGYPPRSSTLFEQTQPLTPSLRQALEERPRFASLPGGRGVSQAPFALSESEIPPTPPTLQLRPASRSYTTRQYDPPRRRKRRAAPLLWTLAALLVAALGLASFLALSQYRPAAGNANLAGAITPPAAPFGGQTVPLAAGSRLVFLRDGALWSVLAEGGKHQPERLTPANVQVAAGWVVNPPQGNHDAGDLLAYVDLQGRRVHTLRSDGQQDTAVPLALLPASGAANWQSASGQAVLTSLAWSPDSSSLAFVADPTGSGQTGLYLFTPANGTVRALATGIKGSAAQPAWSPDGSRLAFSLAHDGVISVMDYNLKDHSARDLSNLAEARGNSEDGVLSLNWFTNGQQTAVTWSLGSIGRVSGVWIHRVGSGAATYPQRLTSGTYLQAQYSPGSNNETGGWLLVTSVAGRAGDLWRLNLAANGQSVPLSQGKQISFARWSPDGTTIFYLDENLNGVGHGHLVNVVTGNDQLLPEQAAMNPAPDWSADNLQLAYSTGTQIAIANTQHSGQLTHLHLQGQISGLSWSPAAVHQLIISLSGPQPGLYLVDTRQNTSLQLAPNSIGSVIQWTQIP